MWIVRELLRLLWAIVVVATVAAVISIIIALAHGGDMAQEMRITFLCVGCFVLLLAGAGNQMTTSSRRATGRVRSFTALGILPGGLTQDATPKGPTLTASAVLFASGLVVLVLGLIV